MKRLTFTLMVMIFAMSMPMAAFAMDHGTKGKEMADEMMQHGDMDHGDQGEHKGHDMKMDHADMKMEHAEGKAHDMKMEHTDKMDHDMHKGHDMAAQKGDFTEIGKDTKKGVVATVKVKAYDEATIATMTKMGMSATHHVMVFFADEKTGDAVASGKVALKIKGDDAKPAMLMLMGGGFGSDISVGEGMSTFEIGTKLEDGKKRQFSVMFHNM